MTSMSEEEKARWIAALARAIRRRLAATVRSSRALAEADDRPAREPPPAAKEDR